MKVSLIGRGQVGLALAPALTNAGHQVRFGVRDPSDAKHGGSETPVYATRDASALGGGHHRRDQVGSSGQLPRGRR
ncbi:NAD(P)-binding domain-containing protein [Methylobacterium aquaticum]|uniref:NAD(P)-binding domain-containing protein n=1 Tax=Methylobacterium aquaticum TaxID=270351 RepID=UPI003D184D16